MGALHTRVHNSKQDVILEVLSHSWQVDDCIDVDAGQVLCVSNARDLENLRSVNGTSRQNSLLLDRDGLLLCVFGSSKLSKLLVMGKD